MLANSASRNEMPSPPLLASKAAIELVLPLTVSLALVTAKSPNTTLMLLANSDVELVTVLVAVAVILVPGAITGMFAAEPVAALKFKLPTPSVVNQLPPR